jgi:hypothetical protein
VQGFLAQLRRYAGFVAWFFKDALLRYRTRLVLIIAANVAGVALQAAAVIIAYRYAAAVESGKLVQAAGFTLDPRGSLGLLAATAVTVFLLAVVSAVLIMRARVAGAKLALDYADYCRQRVYLLASRLHEYTMQTFLELARRDPQYCYIVLRTLVYALLHVGTVVVAGLALFYLNAKLTLIVLLILAAAAWFLRQASIRGASFRARQQQYAAERAKEHRLLEERVARSPAPLAPSSTILQQAFAEGGSARARAAVLGQRQALEGGKLVAQVAIGCALFVVLLVQGSDTLGRAGNWSALLAYVAALIFFGGSLARAGRMLVSMNRFYPPLARHARFVERARTRPATPPAASWRVDAPRLGGAAGTLVLQPGDRVALVLPGEVNRYSMVALAKALGGFLPWFAGAGLPGGDLREDFGLPAGCTLAELEAELARLGVKHTALQESQPPPPATAFALMALSGVLNRCPILVLEQAGLALLDSAALLGRAANAVVFVAHPATQTAAMGQWGESAVVICGAEEAIGWAPREAFHSDEVQRALARSAADARSARVAAPEDDLDEVE